ncbi:GMC family oxidoreductase [Algiphilus sp. W345]|uniref:GMC family oxidoreductase n=1 Tax=Banduia mediterranea TaxID=3075609 RepID=A0ABU2WIL4_9GAMM|nr:GMC family oxidoreductase [Algiphilus sp. W345]MDT0497131.1 GMC family oxidoreductase [Algiphilus sp. W345]
MGLFGRATTGQTGRAERSSTHIPNAANERNRTAKARTFFEQAPNATSRMTLGGEADSFGLPRVRLNWQLTFLDHHSHCVLASALADDLLRRGIARRLGPIGLADEVQFSNHPLGTTRMSIDPGDGVVDTNCRVHGIDNLFTAGGSVFPTGS